MTACRYDRTLRMRVARGEHDDDCPTRHGDPDGCPAAGPGCAPCPDRHCAVCGRAHTSEGNPVTCPECVARVRDDLTDTTTAHALLPEEAMHAGRDGKPVAADPIPGGIAQILAGPTITADRLRPTSLIDHYESDPIPPLAVLAHWEDVWRDWLTHPEGPDQPTIPTTAAYLNEHLPRIMQTPRGPDVHAFAEQVRGVRASLEAALHDEQAPDLGVECFECGGTLVRRHRPAAPCRHDTPARRELQRWARLGYPEALTRADVRAARQPCGRCDQGGIADPAAGLSWECPTCRHEYDPGEYATAVRRDLLSRPDHGGGWTHVSMAADAATTMTGTTLTAGTVRKWAQRGKVDTRRERGTRLVYWPDVAEEAMAYVARQRARQRANPEATA